MGAGDLLVVYSLCYTYVQHGSVTFYLELYFLLLLVSLSSSLSCCSSPMMELIYVCWGPSFYMHAVPCAMQMQYTQKMEFDV